jgi:hypothetical protein
VTRRLLPRAPLLCCAVAIAASIAAGVALAITPPANSPTASAPARLLVTSEEWRLTMSRARVAAGPIVIQLDNRGEDPHDLRLRRLNRRGRRVGRTIAVPETPPGGLSEIEDGLRRGRWRLWCSLPGHRAAGMRATLRAR